MSPTAIDLSYAVAQFQYARYRMREVDCTWQVEAWDWRCRELAARLLDTGEPLLLF
jgi:hypothetical protein